MPVTGFQAVKVLSAHRLTNKLNKKERNSLKHRPQVCNCGMTRSHRWSTATIAVLIAIKVSWKTSKTGFKLQENNSRMYQVWLLLLLGGFVGLGEFRGPETSGHSRHFVARTDLLWQNSWHSPGLELDRVQIHLPGSSDTRCVESLASLWTATKSSAFDLKVQFRASYQSYTIRKKGPKF